MTKIQAQGVPHITCVGSNRAATIDVNQGLLGMPLVFVQPNLDVPDETHLYFDPGDGDQHLADALAELAELRAPRSSAESLQPD